MSQKFNEKRIAVAVSLAMAAGFAGANQFAASTLTTNKAAGVNVPKTATLVGTAVTGLTASLNSVDGTLTPISNSGSLVFTLDNGAKFVSGSTIGVAISGAGFVTAAPGNGAFTYTNAAGTATVSAGSATLAYNFTAAAGSSSFTIPSVTGAGAGTSFSLTLSGLSLDTSASTIDTPINLSIDASSTYGGSGLTTGASTKIATPKSAGATATVSATVPTVVANSTLSVPAITVSENLLSSISALSGGKIRLTLPSGVNFAAQNVSVANSGTDTTNLGWASGTAAGASNILVLSLLKPLGGLGTSTTAGTSNTAPATFVLPAISAFVPNGQAAGDINVTVEATLDKTSDTYSSLGSLKAGTVAAATGAVSAYSSGSATTQYANLFSGRVYAGSISNAYTTGVLITENIKGTLAASGTVTYKATGVTATSGSNLLTFSDVTGDLAGSGVTTAADTVTYTVATASGTATKLAATLGGFKVTGKSGTQAQFAVSSTTNVSGSTVTVANIVDATTVSASGAIPVGSVGTTVALPDVVISETQYGAITASGKLGLSAPFSQVDSFDTTSATVKVLKQSDGTDVTTSVLTSPTMAVGSAASSSSNLTDLIVTLGANPSTSTTGAVKVVISGLKAKIGASATGDVSLTVGGVAAATTDVVTSADIDPNNGAQLTTSTVKVAGLAAANTNYVATTVTGPITAQTIAADFAPATSDAGKQGSVFVAAVVPNVGAFFMNSSGAFTAFADCKTAPTYSTGTLTSISALPILKTATDLSALVGTDVYVGYGVGGALSPVGTACTNMLNNGTYSKAYTVK